MSLSPVLAPSQVNGLTMKLLYSIVSLATVSFCVTTHGEVPLKSSDELKSESTHIVVGEVRAVTSSS